MAESKKGTYAGDPDDPVPSPDDPGGSRANGYSADPDPTPSAPVPEDGPIPLAEAPKGAAARPPQSASGLPPTSRDEPSDGRVPSGGV